MALCSYAVWTFVIRTIKAFYQSESFVVGFRQIRDLIFSVETMPWIAFLIIGHSIVVLDRVFKPVAVRFAHDT